LFSEAYHLFERMLATTDASEISCIERRVATARVFLAVFAMVAFLMEPTELGHSLLMYELLGFYMVNSILVLILLESVDSFVPSPSACSRRCVARVHLGICRGSEKSVLSIFCFCVDGSGLSLESLGDAEHDISGSGVAVGGKLCPAACSGNPGEHPLLARNGVSAV
jgi:hypothetical protein